MLLWENWYERMWVTSALRPHLAGPLETASLFSSKPSNMASTPLYFCCEICLSGAAGIKVSKTSSSLFCFKDKTSILHLRQITVNRSLRIPSLGAIVMLFPLFFLFRTYGGEKWMCVHTHASACECKCCSAERLFICLRSCHIHFLKQAY